MSSNVLDGVVALVCCRTNGDSTVQNAMISKLHSLGARAVSRLSKDVTHIIFKHKLHPTADEKLQEDMELRQLFEKAFKVMPPPLIVSPLWVYSSHEEGRRAMERKYAIAKPNEPSLKHVFKSPHSVRKATGAAVRVVSSLKKPRRRQVAEADACPTPADSGPNPIRKRARTTYEAVAATTPMPTATAADAAGVAATGGRVPAAAAAAAAAVTDIAAESVSETANAYDAALPAERFSCAAGIANADAAETDENICATNPATTSVLHPECRLKSSGVLQPSTAVNEVTGTSANVADGKQADVSNSHQAVPLSAAKLKGSTAGKRRSLAATAGAIVSVIDAAFGIVGSGKGATGSSLRKRLLGSKRRTTRLGGTAVAAVSGDGLQTIAVGHCGDQVEVLDCQGPSDYHEGGVVHILPAAHALELNGPCSPSLRATWPSGSENAEQNHISSSPAGHQSIPFNPSTPPDGPPAGQTHSMAVDPSSSRPPTGPRQQQQQQSQQETRKAPDEAGDEPKELVDMCDSDSSEEDADVDALLAPTAPTTTPSPPAHAAMPPRCPSPIPTTSPMRTSTGQLNTMAVSMPSSPAARTSPSPGRIRQQWSIPPAVEARRASNESPAWKLRAEAALTEAAQAFNAHTMQVENVVPPAPSLPPFAKSPSQRDSPARRHTRSMSTSSLESNGDSPGALKTALSDNPSSEDDMMLGGVPNIVAKNMSPQGKLASPSSFTKSRPDRRCKKSLTEEVSKALSGIKVGDGDAAPGRRSTTRGTKVVDKQVEKQGDKQLIKAKPSRSIPTPAPATAPTGKQVGSAVATRSRTAALNADAQHRSASVPPVRPAWGVNTVPAQDAVAKSTTRLLRSTVSLPVKQVASVIDRVTDSAKANKSGLASSQRLVALAQPKAFANRLAASAEGLLQASVVDAARRATKGNVNKLVSIAEKTTAASRAKANGHQVVEPAAAAAPPAASKPAAASHPAVTSGRARLKYLAYTSLSAEMSQLVKSAVRRLPGLRMCIDGNEDGRITHLVVGAERRTLKVLLAIANGAYLLSPAWATDSLAADEWLPEDQYPADVRFAKVAERVRELQASGRLVKPLEGHMVFIHVPTNAHGDRAERPSERRHTLQRLVQALGGKVAPARACTLCIACEDVRRPKGMPEGVKMIRDEWLFLVAENYQQVGMAEHMIIEEER